MHKKITLRQRTLMDISINFVISERLYINLILITLKLNQIFNSKIQANFFFSSFLCSLRKNSKYFRQKKNFL